MYTEDNFDQWVEWAPLGKAHLDAFTMLLKFDKKNLLIAPNLRKSEPEIVAEAWDTYRKGLLNGIQQALTMGCKWKQILTNLSLAFSDPESGYPKLQLAVKLALMDTKLMSVGGGAFSGKNKTNVKAERCYQDGLNCAALPRKARIAIPKTLFHPKAFASAENTRNF